MASDPGDRDQNYFAILGAEPSPKRKTPNLNNPHDFPYLKKTNKSSNLFPTSCPKFLIIKNKDTQKPLKSYNIFLLQKALESITSEPLSSISFTRDGDLLVLTKSKQQTTKFLKATKLSNVCEISVSLHPTLNIVKGVIYSTCLTSLSESEIVEGLHQQGATECKKITKLKDGKIVNTPLHIISFSAYELPKEVNVAWLKVKVEPYIPSPMQCKNCFIIGHTAKHCKSVSKCNVCSTTTHDPSPCIKVECINCKQNHRSDNKNCPTLQKRKDILTFKTLNKCSFREATEKINNNQKEYVSPTEELEEAIEKKTTKFKEQKTNNHYNHVDNHPSSSYPSPSQPSTSNVTHLVSETRAMTSNITKQQSTQKSNSTNVLNNPTESNFSTNHSITYNNDTPISLRNAHTLLNQLLNDTSAQHTTDDSTAIQNALLSLPTDSFSSETSLDMDL